ncbi:MAG: ABC transporter ATP-binding protein [Acidobacteria bacterium]|nr:ABC transporter ATP-binding protein [Acidobacteriota bacterium]MBI3656131.1 ABC transporter ATP-binding protein [Acidobacteriota bacterium]
MNGNDSSRQAPEVEASVDYAAAPAGSPIVIDLQDVVKVYDLGGSQVQALKGVTFKVRAGEFVAIMGHSGSGKSTMLNLIGCLDRPTSGRYLLDNIDVSRMSRGALADIRNRKIGFIFQNFNLLQRTSVWENVELPMLYAEIDKHERAARVRHALEVVKIPHKAKMHPNQLSGGEQQRVAIARSLVNKPAIILADEPTGNLDSSTSGEIMEFLQTLNREQRITLVMVTHETDIAAYAERVTVFKDGLILREYRNESS